METTTAPIATFKELIASLAQWEIDNIKRNRKPHTNADGMWLEEPTYPPVMEALHNLIIVCAKYYRSDDYIKGQWVAIQNTLKAAQ
jgi:hypothetical protein